MALMVGELSELAAVGADDVDVDVFHHVGFFLRVGGEENPAAVGREAGGGEGAVLHAEDYAFRAGDIVDTPNLIVALRVLTGAKEFFVADGAGSETVAVVAEDACVAVVAPDTEVVACGSGEEDEFSVWGKCWPVVAHRA